jgi:hypothetical protein
MTGHQLWENYSKIMEQWATKINLTNWIIYGGEPTLNPTLYNWTDGILDLWPDSNGQIFTNGSTITEKNTKLYNYVKTKNNKIKIVVSVHNRKDYDLIINRIKNWLVGPIRKSYVDYRVMTDSPDAIEDFKNKYNSIKGSNWPEVYDFEDWHTLPQHIKDECVNKFNFSPDNLDYNCNIKLVDAHGVTVIVSKQYLFYKGAHIIDANNHVVRLHNSDPDVAHSVCENTWCTEMYKGKIYKCNTLSRFYTLDEQFNLEISDSDRELLYSYRSADSSMSNDQINNWLGKRLEVIDQCKFCPEDRSSNEIFPTTKKIKIYKKSQIYGKDTT